MEKHQPIIRARAEHNISRRDIDPDALKVLYRLIRRGHVAYLVGGGVRDLLLGRTPKDFDISTDARPNELKRLFRNCFLIGRRFRLAHIKYGEKVIETSTFRCQPKNDGDDLLQLEDNTFGSPEEDALRRDFTINGLFYDVETFSVIDYVGGLPDLEKRVIRSIGDPSIRFCEDPVRMVRAIRFASRLGFAIEEHTFSALLDCREEIRKASVPRLLEELYRLYAFGSGCAAFRLLRETKLLDVLLPEVAEYLDATDMLGFAPLWSYLEGLDKGDMVVAQPTNALMLAALLLPIVLKEIGKSDSGLTQKALADAYEKTVVPIAERLRVPRRTQDTLMRIITTQHRFFTKARKGFSKTKFAAQDFFPEALALYELHLTATGKDFAKADEWRTLWESLVDEAELQPPMSESASDGARRDSKRSRRRRKRRDHPADDGNVEANSSTGVDALNDDDTDFPGSANEPGEPENPPLPAVDGSRHEPVASAHISLVSPASHLASSDASVNNNATSDAATGMVDENGEVRSTRSRRRRRRKKKKTVDGASLEGQEGISAGSSSAGDVTTSEEKENPLSGSVREARTQRPERSERRPALRPEEKKSRSDSSKGQEDDLTAAPLTPFEVIKQVQGGKRPEKKKHHRRGDNDKQIIHDYRPTDAGPSFDKASEAPHWLDEI